MKTNKKIILLLILTSFFMMAITATIQWPILKNRSVVQQLTSDTYIGGSDGHVGTAINLLIHGSFYGGHSNPFFGLVPRSPVYSLLVAVSFVIFGVSANSIWILNALCFVSSVLLLYAISRRFLDSYWAALPPLFLSLFWGAAEYIWIINTETFTLFSVTLFIWGFLRYKEDQKVWHLASAAVFFSFLVLDKAILYYFVYLLPFMVGYALYKNYYSRKLWRHWVLFFLIILVIVGGWRVRNQIVLGSPDFSRGGHSLLIHSKSTLLSARELTGFALSQLFGDYIADKFIPGFADNPQPLSIQGEVSSRWGVMRREGVPELETDKIFWSEAIANIKAHPIKFVLVSPLWFLRMNGPINYNLIFIDHMFVGTYPQIPGIVKILILLLIHVPWYAFIVVVFIMAFKLAWQIIRQKKFSSMVWILLLVFYLNFMYAFFTHAEPRYVLPVMPFYFLFFTQALYSWRGNFNRIIKKF